MSWPEIALFSGEGGSTPGGADTQVQFNNGGAFAGSASLTFNKATGALSATRVLVGDGTAAAPALSFSSVPSTGFYVPSGNLLLTFSGTPYWLFAANLTRFASGMGIGWASGSVTGTAEDTILTRGGAAATLQLGAANAASPIAQTLQAQGSRGGTDTDVAGANLTIRSGAGTGAATGSTIIFQTPQATGSGTTQQTQTTRMSLSGGLNLTCSAVPTSTNVFALGGSTLQWALGYFSQGFQGSCTTTLTESSATDFVWITVANSTAVAGRIVYTIFAKDASNTQAKTGELFFSAVATSAGAITAATLSDVNNQNPCTSGTLTNTMTQDTATSNTLKLKANAVSSLTQTTLEIWWRVELLGGTATVTPK